VAPVAVVFAGHPINAEFGLVANRALVLAFFTFGKIIGKIFDVEVD
jgi:hypothetical protein